MYRASLVCCFVNILAGNNDKQCCVNVFSDQQKNILRAKRENRTVQSEAERSIVHKFLKRLCMDQA